jgi:hypothetical protein
MRARSYWSAAYWGTVWGTPAGAVSVVVLGTPGLRPRLGATTAQLAPRLPAPQPTTRPRVAGTGQVRPAPTD